MNPEIENVEILDETIPGTEDETVADAVEPGENEPAAPVVPTAEELQEIESKKQSRFQRQQQRYEEQLRQNKEEIEFLRRVASGGVAAPAPVAAQNTGEPRIEDYEGKSITEYIAARDNWREGHLIEKIKAETAHSNRVEKQKDIMLQRVNEVKKDLPDWDEVMAIDDDEVYPVQDTINFIAESDVGPRIAYALKKDPDLHEKLNKMSPLRRVAELGKLEDKLSTKVEPKADTKRVTTAPAKLSEPKGQGKLETMDPASAARVSYAAWKIANAAREAAKAKK